MHASSAYLGPNTLGDSSLRKSLSKVLRTTTALVVAGFSLSACSVGPNFERPAAPGVNYSETAPQPTASADVTGGASQSFREGGEIAADWWALFKSPALNDLIEQALANSPTLKSAEAALRQAQELQSADFSVLLPAVDGSFSSTRQKTTGFAGGAAPPPFSMHTAQVRVSYGIDLWGAARRTYEADKAATEGARFRMEAARLSLTSNVVAAALQRASLRAQIQATQTILDLQTQQLGLLREQLRLGAIAEADALTLETAVAQTRALLPTLEKALGQNRNLLLALAGRYPSERLDADFDLATFALPTELPVSVPAQLVAQRPDVRASETLAHIAAARVGVATALMLPQINLSASLGTSNNDIENLFSAGTGIWSLAAGVTQPIFHGGQLLHQKRAAVAAYEGALEDYRGTVISAFQNVGDALHALEVDAVAVKAQLDAERAANTSLSIAKTQYDIGATNFLTLLDAQRTYQTARINLVQAQAARYADTAALFAALGGGWWNRPENQDQVIGQK